MPNAGKKDVQPKKLKVQDALDFARGFVASVGNKETALSKADHMSKSAVDESTKNFWNNIKGHISKL